MQQNNKALSGDLLRKINADKDKAVNAWIDSGGGNEGFKAVTNIFQKGGGNTNNDPLGIRNQIGNKCLVYSN